MSPSDSVIAPKVESPLGRHRVYIWTAGCQMNRDDGERIARELMLQGHIPVSHPDRASFVILNGCGVRDNSDRKTYGRIDALGARKKRDPDLMVALTGCSANASQSELQPYNNNCFGQWVSAARPLACAIDQSSEVQRLCRSPAQSTSDSAAHTPIPQPFWLSESARVRARGVHANSGAHALGHGGSLRTLARSDRLHKSCVP